MGCSDGAPRIAGNLTTEDWDERKMLLDGDDATDADWRKAVDDFFLQRIQKRYLDPIKILQVIGDGDGEGFAIVTIQCALIEFLAALRSGKKYTTKRGQVGENEYNSCRELFRDFLHPVSPFATCFPSPESAENFYKFIRCGLLHEAQSKSGWRIRVNNHSKLTRHQHLKLPHPLAV